MTVRRRMLAVRPLDGAVTHRTIVGRAARRIMVYVLFLYTFFTIDVWLMVFLFQKCGGVTSTTPTGTSTSGVARTKVGNVGYGSDIGSCSVAGTIALTFDDGPYIYTSQVLDTLKTYGAKATFFVT